LHEFDNQQLSLALVAEVDLFEQIASIVGAKSEVDILLKYILKYRLQKHLYPKLRSQTKQEINDLELNSNHAIEGA